jgi:uncharacterized protein YoxC
MSDQIEKFKALEKKRQDLATRKIRLEEQYNAKRESLAAVIAEVKQAGYDPKTLKKTIVEMEERLSKDIEEFEASISKASQQLAAIES